MNTRSSLRVSRPSNIVSTPEQFVTVEIHNQMNKKKNFNHRQSIFRELLNTQNLVESSLNKKISDNSRFKLNVKRLKFNKSKQKLFEQERFQAKQIEQKQNAGILLNENINNKIKQIGNISRYFQRVCQNKSEDKKVNCNPHRSLDITLPINSYLDTPDRFTSKEKQELAELRNNIRQWKQKIKEGRAYIKTRQRYYPKINLSRTSSKPHYSPQDSDASLSYRELIDTYFHPIRKQRMTIPFNNHFEDLLVEKRQKRKLLGYMDHIEKQSSNCLKQFIQGGEPSSFNEFSNHLSISSFINSKQQFKTLDKIYNYIKEHNIYDLKDMNIDSFDTSSMLSLVYFIQKGNGLSELEKKAFKKKLYLID